MFQLIEIYWANLKGDKGRKYNKGRNFSGCRADSAEIECNSIIRGCDDCMKAWLEYDDVLSGTVDA